MSDLSFYYFVPNKIYCSLATRIIYILYFLGQALEVSDCCISKIPQWLPRNDVGEDLGMKGLYAVRLSEGEMGVGFGRMSLRLVH